MNNQQTSKKNMFNKMITFFSGHSAVWAAFARLVAEIANFASLNSTLDNYVSDQLLPTKGVTNAKDEKFLAVVNIIVKFARKARVWAHDDNKLALEGIFDIHKEDFFSGPHDEALGKLVIVRNALNDNIGSLAGVNVLPADITNIDLAVTAYQNAKGTPGATKGIKEAGTDGIDETIHDIDTSLEIIDDLFISEYAETNAGLVDEYRHDRKIETVGVRHQSIGAEVTYSDGSGPAEGITLKIVELDKTNISDILGVIPTIRGKIGTYHIEFSGPNIHTKALIAPIKRGSITVLHIQVIKL